MSQRRSATPPRAAGKPDASSIPGAALELVRRFADLAVELPQVRRVFLHDSDGDLTIWAVIDATPFDRNQRYPVYAAQAQALRQAFSDSVGFRLVNLREFDGGTDGVVPNDHILWERAGSSRAHAR